MKKGTKVSKILEFLFIHLKKSIFFSVGVHVMVQDVNEFAPKWNIRSEDIANEPLHTLTTGVSIEEGQLFEEVSASVCNVLFARNGMIF